MAPEAIRTALTLRLGWIRRQVAAFAAQEREPEREFVSSETHWFLRRRHRLRVVQAARAGVRLTGGDYIELAAPDPSDGERLARISASSA